MQTRLALSVFALLTLFHTWPLASAPWRESLNHNADVQYAEWSMSWMARALVTDPTALFDGNIFAPETGTLAWSEPLLTPALAGAPLLWLGASPVLVYNLLLFAGLILTGWTTWFLVRDWTGSSGAGLVAGALATFNVHLLTRLPHLMAAHAWTLVVTLLLADRVRRNGRPRDIVLLGLAVAATAANSLYALAFAGLVVLFVGVGGRLRPRATAAVAAGGLLGLLIATPVLLPYLDQAAAGHTRPIEMAADFSASPAGYLASTSLVHQGWSAGFYRDDVNVFFAGVTGLALAALGFAVGIGERSTRRRVLVVLALGVVGLLLSLGPATSIYRWLYEWALPLRGLRAAARFGYLYLLAIAVAAGYGIAWLERRTPSRRVAGALVAGALALVTFEAWHGPVRTTPFTGVPPIYSLLTEPEEVMLVEVPFYPPDAVHENGPYVLNSTAHWRPVMNGHSGFTPMSYRRRSEAFWFFPEDWAIAAIRDQGATHVMVHLEFFRHEAPMVRAALVEQQDLWLVAADSQGHMLFEVLSPPGVRGSDD
jgi:hypothetical protein